MRITESQLRRVIKRMIAEQQTPKQKFNAGAYGRWTTDRFRQELQRLTDEESGGQASERFIFIYKRLLNALGSALETDGPDILNRLVGPDVVAHAKAAGIHPTLQPTVTPKGSKYGWDEAFDNVTQMMEDGSITEVEYRKRVRAMKQIKQDTDTEMGRGEPCSARTRQSIDFYDQYYGGREELPEQVLQWCDEGL